MRARKKRKRERRRMQCISSNWKVPRASNASHPKFKSFQDYLVRIETTELWGEKLNLHQAKHTKASTLNCFRPWGTTAFDVNKPVLLPKEFAALSLSICKPPNFCPWILPLDDPTRQNRTKLNQAPVKIINAQQNKPPNIVFHVSNRIDHIKHHSLSKQDARVTQEV